MKKVWKGLTAVGVAAAMAATGFIGATAANAVDVTVKLPTGVASPDMTNNQFNIYQIFTADYSVDDNKLVIANVTGFANGVSSDFLDKVKAIKVDGAQPFENCTSAKDVAEVLDGEVKDSAIAKAFAKATASNKGTALAADTAKLPLGYYVIVDETATDTDKTNNFPVLFANTDADLDTVELDLKTDIPTIEKKVSEAENATIPTADSTDAKWNDAADHEIGEVVYFKLTLTVGDMTYYDTYKLKAWDELSTGLTYDTTTKPVISTSNATLEAQTDPQWRPTAVQDGQRVSWDFGDIKTKGFKYGDTITIIYGATLNEYAAVGTDPNNAGTGNLNKAWLQYSNNPNSDTIGDTTPDKVTVFTYKIDGTKVDANDQNKKLSGAEFVLYKQEGTTKYYRDFANNTWSTTLPAEDANNRANFVKTTDTKGKIGEIKGVESGTYYLQEIKAPTGYNLPANPFKVVVKGYRSAQQGETGTTVTVGEGDSAQTFENMIEVATGNLTADTQKLEVFTVQVDSQAATANTGAYTIGNAKGTNLPETGGMGTVVLYTVGGLIVLIAGVGLAVALRRRQA